MLRWRKKREAPAEATPSPPMPYESLIGCGVFNREDGEDRDEAVLYYLLCDIEGTWWPVGVPLTDPRRIKAIRTFREDQDPDARHRYVRSTVVQELIESPDGLDPDIERWG